MKYYTGVGARKTPIETLEIFTSLAAALSKRNFILRSGGAKGADSAFEKGAEQKDIFYANDATEEAMEIAKRYHPAWDRMSSYAKKLHGRNAFQVLGRDLKTPANFLVCWTPDGCIDHPSRSIRTGGTGTAISIAWANRVEVFNLKREDHLFRITNWLKTN